MRIGTWNVEYAASVKKNDRRLDVLRSHPADIWILTETHDDLNLAPSYKAIPSLQRPIIQGGRNVRHGSRWTTIWSSFPIRELLPVHDEERTVAALIDTPLGPLMVFGTVLPWHCDRGNQPSSAIVRNWSEQYRVIDEQTKEWAELRHAHPDTPLCVAGDINLNLGGPHWYGTNQGREAIREAMRQNGLVCATEYDRIPHGILAHSPIDHVLIPESLSINSHVVEAWEGTTSDGIRLSDHSGLVVNLN